MVGSSSSTAHDTVIDITNAATRSLVELISSNRYKSSESCIFKTPSILFRHNKSAYLPNGFSIGPLHHNKSNLKATRVIKLQYFNAFVSRNSDPRRFLNYRTELSEKHTIARHHQETYLSELIQVITEVEDYARACYAVHVNLGSKEFVKMLVIDGCFLVELFCRNKFVELQTVNDPIFNMPCWEQFLLHDLILLENQIPWLIIQRLYTMSFYSTKYEEYSVLDLAVSFLAPKFLVDDHVNVSECKNIVDLLRSALISSSKLQPEPKSPAESEPDKFCCIFSRSKKVERDWVKIPSASSLIEAGIELKSSPSKCILDIQFINGILHVPTLEISETTEAMFRNLICYEQCCNFHQSISHYVVLLDHLINTSKDLSILCDRQIIENWIDPVKATDMFNNIYHDTCVNVPSCYKKIEDEVDEYCRRRWPRWRAAYVRNYFSTPWAIASQVVAGILLILTLLQTIFTIKG